MKRFFTVLLSLLIVAVVAAYLYIQSVWNPKMPQQLVARVDQIAAAHGGYTPLSRIPLFLQQAVIATEDHSFYHNMGIDFEAIGRALVVDLQSGKPVQGASTITQQLVKDIFLTDAKTIDRKLKQAAISVMMSRALPKNQILSLYLNEVYLGHGAYGVGDAARIYFGRDISQLTKAQCALIAGLPQAPSTYDPLVNPQLAKERQKVVLQSMVNFGYLSEKKAVQIANAPLYLVSSP